MEADELKNLEIKEKMRKEYFRRIKEIQKTKLNSGDALKENNSRPVALIGHVAGLIKWTKDEFRTIDRKTRKTMAMNRALHPQANVDRLHIPKNNNGKGMLSAEGFADMETARLMKYVESSNVAEGEGILGRGKTNKKVRKK